MKHRYPHKIECAIRGIARCSNACSKLSRFLIEQQRPDFQKQDHLFDEAAQELKKALRWVKAGKTPVKEES
jgi:hypothetical protein